MVSVGRKISRETGQLFPRRARYFVERVFTSRGELSGVCLLGASLGAGGR